MSTLMSMTICCPAAETAICITEDAMNDRQDGGNHPSERETTVPPH